MKYLLHEFIFLLGILSIALATENTLRAAGFSIIGTLCLISYGTIQGRYIREKHIHDYLKKYTEEE